MNAKHRAAIAAIDELRSGMTVGLGTGSTAEFFIDALGDAVRTKKLTDITGVATSIESERRAVERGIRVISLDDAAQIDVTVDGADEIGPHLSLIKGLGGALLREKIVAQNSDRMIVIADESKVVETLGTQAPLPVEVVPFGYARHADFFRATGCEPALRMTGGKPFITDNGNYIYDLRYTHIDVPTALERALHKRAGVVETGLFLSIAKLALIGTADGVHRREK